jgi:hypothetical protein
MVCDDKGGHYKSKCDYALQTCQQKISLDRDRSGSSRMHGLKIILCYLISIFE